MIDFPRAFMSLNTFDGYYCSNDFGSGPGYELFEKPHSDPSMFRIRNH